MEVERQRQREIQRQTGRQTDRKTGRQAIRQAGRQATYRQNGKAKVRGGAHFLYEAEMYIMHLITRGCLDTISAYVAFNIATDGQTDIK